MTAQDNVMVWDHQQAGHYEVWYLTCNHNPTRTGFWIRYVIEAPRAGEPYGMLWFAAFDADDPTRTVALHTRVPITSLKDAAVPFAIQLGGAELRDDRARGRLAGAGHDVSWDLAWVPSPRTHRHLPDLIYRTAFADTRALAPNLDVPVRGRIVVDGRRFDLDDMPGGQTHLWGRKHAHAWAWGHCNNFDDRRGVALEALSVVVKKRGVTTPPLTLLALYLDGEAHRLTELRHTLLNRGQFGTARFVFSARSSTIRLAGEFRCRPDDMVLAPYVDPDGEPCFCANSCVAHLELTVRRRSSRFGRFAPPERLVSSAGAHFEVAGREPDPAIVRAHASLDPQPASTTMPRSPC